MTPNNPHREDFERIMNTPVVQHRTHNRIAVLIILDVTDTGIIADAVRESMREKFPTARELTVMAYDAALGGDPNLVWP